MLGGQSTTLPRATTSWPPTFSRGILSLWSWPELPNDIRRLARRGHVDTEWSAGRTRAIEIGSRAFLVRVGVRAQGHLRRGLHADGAAAGAALAAREGGGWRDDAVS